MQDGQIWGYGTYTWKDGTEYVGTFYMGEKEGNYDWTKKSHKKKRKMGKGKGRERNILNKLTKLYDKYYPANCPKRDIINIRKAMIETFPSGVSLRSRVLGRMVFPKAMRQPSACWYMSRRG